MEPIVCRTLRREFRLHVPDEAARALFRFLEVDPDVVGRTLAPVDVFISRRHGFWRMEIADELLLEGTATHLIWESYKYFFRDVMSANPNDPMLHGASVLIGDRRLAIVGDKAAGKTTLMLHLLSQGHAIEGDEHIVLMPDSVLARPRTLRVREGSLPLVAGLAAIAARSPRISLWDGGYSYAVSPRAFGRDWTVRPGQIDALILVESNHGGRSVTKRLPNNLAFTSLMRNVLVQKGSIGLQVARVRKLATTVPAFSLRLGDLEGAEKHLKRIATA